MSRTAFEAWFSDDGKYPRACERSREGGYVLAHAADAWHAWQAAQADAYERAARLCEEHYAGPISAVIFEHEHETAQVLAGFIRALAKEATR